jgi:uroporphyrinogen-III decarboxylase
MPPLTPRQLLLRLIYQQPGDRIPVSPFIHVNYVKEFFGTHDVDWVEKTPEVYKHFGFDVMHRNCTPVYDAYGPSGAAWQVQIETEPEGRDETKHTSVRTPEGDLDCTEALRWIYEYDAESSPTKYFIQSEADLDLMIKYLPPITHVDVSDITRAKAATGEDGVVAPWIQGAFNLIAYYYRKVDDLLVDALVNPDFYHKLMRWGLERYKSHIQCMLDARPDVIAAGGNIANGKMVSPAFFKEYIWPYEKELIDFIQSQGVAFLYHNCGYARKLLPVYPSLGMRMYESMTPHPHGDTVLSEAVQVFGEGTTLIGNIDQIDLLRYGTPADIREAVRLVLDTVRGRSHFILATTDYFNDETPHANIHALADAGHEFGH